MKLSRKALAAIATTFALTTAGLSAPANAAETVITVAQSENDATNEGDDTQEPGDSSESSTDSNKDDEDAEVDGGSSDPKEIRDWVAVFTAVVGALSTAFVFIQKLDA